MPDLDARVRALAAAFLGRALRPEEGLAEGPLAAAEARLGIALPAALRAVYRLAGACPRLTEAHNLLLAPEDLELDEAFLIFMDENQSVVSWGVRRDDVGVEDPVVWQRNNTPPPEWYSEEQPLLAFLEGMFRWYATEGL